MTFLGNAVLLILTQGSDKMFSGNAERVTNIGCLATFLVMVQKAPNVSDKFWMDRLFFEA